MSTLAELLDGAVDVRDEIAVEPAPATEVVEETVTTAPPASPPADDQPRAWWVGRLLVVALVLLACVIGFTSVYEAGAYTMPGSRTAPQDDTTAVAYTPTSVATSTPRDPQASADPQPADSPETDATGNAALERRAHRERAAAREQLRRTQVEVRRQRARVRRAARADRELAAFVAASRAAARAAVTSAATGTTPGLAAGTTSAARTTTTEAWTAPLRAAYRITATFGQAGARWSRDHTGLDLAAPIGTPISAVGAGTVIHAGTAGAYGQKVEIRHADGTETWYAHMSRIDVAVGQVVQPGAAIGAVGATGNVTGPHLHLEVRPAGGGPVDPRQALAARGVTL